MDSNNIPGSAIAHFINPSIPPCLILKIILERKTCQNVASHNNHFLWIISCFFTKFYSQSLTNLVVHLIQPLCETYPILRLLPCSWPVHVKKTFTLWIAIRPCGWKRPRSICRLNCLPRISPTSISAILISSKERGHTIRQGRLIALYPT